MVDEKEIRKLIDENKGKEKSYGESYRLRDSDKDIIEESKRELPFLISERKLKNDEEHKIGATKGYDLIEEMCLIPGTTFKKTVSGEIRATRTFLYKYVVGLKMTVEEANEFFKLCGGELREDDPEDLICLRALEDGDSIYDFCDEYEKYIGKTLVKKVKAK